MSHIRAPGSDDIGEKAHDPKMHPGGQRRKHRPGMVVDAYEALGRNAHAEIARVHHAHRDLRSVSVY